jgi:glycine betaine/choline ABC-type transport system substrate-binding protein
MKRLALVLLALLMTACAAPHSGPSFAVGTSADPETTLLANIYAAGLRYYGTAARVETSADPLAALDAGTVTVVPGFTGRLLERFAPGSAARSAEQVYRAMVGVLPEGITAGDYAEAAEDKAALAVTGATAEAWGSRDLSAVVRRCGAVIVGAITGPAQPAAVGSCTLPPARQFASAAAMFDALKAGGITAAWTTTANPSVPKTAVVLVDRKPTLLSAQNVVALYRRNEIDVMQLRAINELAGVLDTAALVDMLGKVKAGADPRAVAEDWLVANPLGH